MQPEDPRMTRAVQRHASGDALPISLPQRMAFTKWKTPPGVKPAWGQNAISMLSALEQQHLRLAMIRRGYYAPPTMSPAEMAEALGGNRLPEPSDNVDRNMDTRAVARGVIPAQNFITGPELNALAEERTAEIANLQDSANDRRLSAMAEIANLQDQLNALFTVRNF